jgi:hypothetical protein
MQKRAVENGVDAEALEAVVDGDAPKADLVALLVALDDEEAELLRRLAAVSIFCIVFPNSPGFI